ncbi:MAG: helix-turn-helix transcriptional regulator [Chitinophagales bacterium]|nr:helix-turn-helix transcriptional regulator [Chitinophagales bacterium]
MLSEIDKYIITRVKKKRLEKKVTQYELAYKLEKPRSFISMAESGKYGKKYSNTLLNEIAKVLECSPKDFMPDKPL